MHYAIQDTRTGKIETEFKITTTLDRAIEILESWSWNGAFAESNRTTHLPYILITKEG
jgi:hypothetical protein